MRTRSRDARPRRSLRDGHRRERDRSRPRVGIRTRKRQALQDLGIYRCVALKDLAAERFGGHPYAARRAVDDLKRRGLAAECKARGPKGNPFRVLHLTEAGRRSAEASRDPGLDSRQRYWSGRAKAREAVHDAAVYRAGRAECRRLVEQGLRVTRIRCDSEMKSVVARAAETARAREGAAAAQRAKEEAARQLGLPVVDGKVLYPDLQIEHAGRDGSTGRVSVEVTTGHYGKGELRAKAAAGFRMHAADGRAARNLESALRSPGAGSGQKSLESALRSMGGGGGGRSGAPARGEGLVEL